MTRVIAILFILGFVWVPFPWVALAPLFQVVGSDHHWQPNDGISFLDDS
jgi:hypothetical protein